MFSFFLFYLSLQAASSFKIQVSMPEFLIKIIKIQHSRHLFWNCFITKRNWNKKCDDEVIKIWFCSFSKSNDIGIYVVILGNIYCFEKEVVFYPKTKSKKNKKILTVFVVSLIDFTAAWFCLWFTSEISFSSF